MFRFESFWPSHPGFMQLVQQSWEKPLKATSSATLISGKLKRLRYALKKWSKSLSKLSLLIENSNKVLLQLDELEEMRQLTIPETNFRSILKAHILHLLKFQSDYWKKRCTFRWATKGEYNKKYFHARATERYRRNNIPTLLLPDGRSIENHDEKAAAFLDCFKQRMGVLKEPEYEFQLSDMIQCITRTGSTVGTLLRI